MECLQENRVVNGELSNLQCLINTPQIPTSMSESSLRVIVLPSFVLPYFKLGIEQDEILKALLIKQEAEWVEWFCPCLLIPIFGVILIGGISLIRERYLIQ